MVNNIKVSIIVPVYNVEAYLDRCIDSLVNQSMKELQIILVDDGSEDNSGLKCDYYANQYENIEVIHQDNQGLTSARRAGLDKCIGEYVIFVDSDDWIELDACQKEYEFLAGSKAKILICDYNIITGKAITKGIGFNGHKLTISEFYQSVAPGYVWNKMYHRSLIDIMKVDIDVSQAEDIAMLLPLVSKLDSDSDMAYVPEAFYNYCKRDDSSSNNKTFIEEYCIEEYLDSLKYILMKSDKRREKEVSFYCMNCLSWGLNSAERKYFKADYCEFFASVLYGYILGNSMITNRFPKLLAEMIGQCGELIPGNLVYGNFENSDSEIFEYCRESWKRQCRNYHIIELNAANCNIKEAPECVKRAIQEREFEFVNDYFCLEYLVENGGIAVLKNVFIHKPLGEIRYNGTFFSYLNDKEIGKAIYGMDKKCGLGSAILGTYSEKHIFNDSFLPLNKRFQFELEGSWKFVPKGTSCTLMNGAVNIYACNIMAEMMDGNCLAEILDYDQYQANKKGLVLIDRNRFLKLITDYKADKLKADTSKKNTENMAAERYIQREAELMEQLNMYKQAYENTISSTAWKITFPLRNIMDILKRKKVNEGEADLFT